MNIEVYSATGQKKGAKELPSSIFEAPINLDLMHQAVVLQQSNRRSAIAHAKSRSEVHGSTKKIFQQKGTGRARRGPVRSPIVRGGGKAFGPKKDRNFHKDMPRSQRHAALRSALSFQAQRSAIIGLETYPETIKTKTFHDLLKKLPVDIGRPMLFVVPAQHHSLWMSSRNVPRIKILDAAYLNPEDVLRCKHIVFVEGSVENAEKVFGSHRDDRKDRRDEADQRVPSTNEKKVAAKKKKTVAKKASPAKAK